MKRKKSNALFVLLAAAISLLVLWAVQRLLVPKYMGMVVEGNLTGEYYKEVPDHDVLILGNCEAYENISPAVLWREFGISSYIRGNANQLMAQSYYLLEDALKYEVPGAVVLSVSSMTNFSQDNESYNRMTLDGMRWSPSKWKAIQATKMEDEHVIEYIFPLLRFHSRWKELEKEDFTYFWDRGTVSHNGYYMRADIRPAAEFPAARRRSDYSFDPRCWDYLEKIRLLCEEKGISLILMKAPALYPAWYDQWDQQIARYAADHGLTYINCMKDPEAIGIDFSHDTYDGGIHMNVYGAEKVARFLGPELLKVPGVSDRRQEEALAVRWEEKCRVYDEKKAEQEEEYLTAAILAVSMAVTPITSYGFGWSKTEAAEEKKEESYAFKTGDTVITMGAEAAPILKALGKAKSTFEQDSCAYQGKSRIYTYENFELGTSTASGKECVESIYIAGTSGTAATQEGVQTGSKKEDVIKAYGKDYKEDFGTLRYTLGNCQLSFYMTNGAVDAIEYVLVPVK